MGFFKKQKVIKFEQNLCNASVNDNEILFVRVSDVVSHKKDVVEVPITHTAFIIIGGGDYRFLDSGIHHVFCDKKQIKRWKLGVTVEVIYMPKETSIVIEWGTKDKLVFRDNLSKKVVEVGAGGKFGIDITNHEQFLRKVVGARKEFDLQDFSKRFAADVVDEYANAFLNVVEDEKLTYDMFDRSRMKIASLVEQELSRKFDKKWGICLVDFVIARFVISEEDKKKVDSVYEKETFKAERADYEDKTKRYLAELERLDDKKWEREKYLLQLEKEDKLAYYEVLKAIGDKKEPERGGRFCEKCGHTIEHGTEFCPACGQRLSTTTVRCPHCNKLNEGNSHYCVACGKVLK